MPVREIRVSFWRRDWFWALLLIAFVFIARTQVFRAGFIWDDESHLTQNPCVVGPLGLRGNLDYDASGLLSARPDDVLGAAQVCRPKPAAIPRSQCFVTRRFGDPALACAATTRKSAAHGWALPCGLLHPVMVQSVAWVTELKNTQSCLFYLLSILCF